MGLVGRLRVRRRSRAARIAVLVVALLVIGFLYFRPIKSFLHTRDTLAERRQEVAELRRERRLLEQRLAGAVGQASLLRSARRLGFVKPGERLFIVKGIEEWRRTHEPARRAAR